MAANESVTKYMFSFRQSGSDFDKNSDLYYKMTAKETAMESALGLDCHGICF